MKIEDEGRRTRTIPKVHEVTLGESGFGENTF
jgi:hypothetical protein